MNNTGVPRHAFRLKSQPPLYTGAGVDSQEEQLWRCGNQCSRDSVWLCPSTSALLATVPICLVHTLTLFSLVWKHWVLLCICTFLDFSSHWSISTSSSLPLSGITIGTELFLHCSSSSLLTQWEKNPVKFIWWYIDKFLFLKAGRIKENPRMRHWLDRIPHSLSLIVN